jgi:serine protease Do
MNDTKGALVAGVEKNSPAAKGGLLPGDVILQFNKNDIVNSSDLPKFVGTTKPKSSAPVEVIRKGKKLKLSIIVGEMPSDKKNIVAKKSNKAEVNRLGLVLKATSKQEKKTLDGRNGLLVVDVKGKAISSQIRPGDIILALNNSPVTTVYSFNKDLNRAPNGKTIAILIYRNGDTLFIPIKISD